MVEWGRKPYSGPAEIVSYSSLYFSHLFFLIIFYYISFDCSRPQILYKISARKNFANFTGKHLFWSLPGLQLY